MQPLELLQALAAARRTLAVAESLTGGLLLDTLTDVPGASRVVRGGVVAYTNDAKRDLLHVPQGLLALHGAASREACVAMAGAARSRFGADYGLATSGIAGPTGSTPAKPLGLSFGAAAGPASHRASTAVHAGGRRDVKRAAVDQSLETLAQLLRDEGIL